MDERYNYKLSEIDDERRPRTPDMKGLLADLDLMDLKLSNFTDIYSASNGGNIDNWETGNKIFLDCFASSSSFMYIDIWFCHFFCKPGI